MGEVVKNTNAGNDGNIEPGMVICVESYIGENSGVKGIKLEEQVLVTETGYQNLSMFPFEESLLSWLGLSTYLERHN